MRIAVANTLAYYDKTTITGVKRFIVQAPGSLRQPYSNIACRKFEECVLKKKYQTSMDN